MDTNVLITAFMSKGIFHELMEQVLHDNKLFYTDFIIEKFKRVLAKKIYYPTFLVKEFIVIIKRFFIKAETAEISEEICRDADDDQILADAKGNEGIL